MSLRLNNQPLGASAIKVGAPNEGKEDVMKNVARLRGILLVSCSAILYGAMPLFTKTLYEFGFDAMSATFWRFAPMLPVLAFSCFITHAALSLSLRCAIGIMAKCGVPSAMTMVLLNAAYDYMDVGTATTIHFLYPVVVALLAFAFYGEKIRRSLLFGIGFIVIGLIAFFVGETQSASLFGASLAFASSVTYAIYLIELDKERYNELNTLVLTFYTAISGTLITVLCGVASGSLVSAFYGVTTCIGGEWGAIVSMVMLPVFSLAAICLLTLGSKSLDAQMTSVIGLFEPVVGLLVGVVFLGESSSDGKLLGTFLILIAILLVIISDMPTPHRPPKGEAAVRLLRFMEARGWL